MPGRSNVLLRLAEVKWLFTPSGSKNGSLRLAEVKCIFTPGRSKVYFYAWWERSPSLRPAGVKWLLRPAGVKWLFTPDGSQVALYARQESSGFFRTEMCFFIRILKICNPPHSPLIALLVHSSLRLFDTAAAVAKYFY